MVEWLVPIGGFWTLAALYLGGFRIEIDDGSAFRNLGGLLLSFALFLVVWWAIRTGAGTALPAIPAILVASIAVLLLLPLLTRIGFRAFGLRIRSAH